MIDYANQSSFRTLLQLEGSVLPRSVFYTLFSVAWALVILVVEERVPNSQQFMDSSDITESAVWSIFTFLGFTLISFRMRTAYSRFWEGTTLLHQMQGEWFESASCLMAFSMSAKATKGEQVAEFRQTLVRLMSLMHGSALESVKKNQQVSYEVIDLRGLDHRTLEILQESSELYDFHRVEVLLHMIQVLMTHNHEIGVLTSAPPILSRVYQTLSRGMVNFINAQKIADTMFPFPFAQLCSWFIIFQSFVLPLLVTSIVKEKSWAALTTLVPMLSLHCLNNTAFELEMPYGDDPNDLPLEQLQKKFNKALLMLLKESADHIPRTCARTTHNWKNLYYGMWATSEMIKDADGEGKRRVFQIQHLGRNTTKTLDMLVQVSKRRSSESDTQVETQTAGDAAELESTHKTSNPDVVQKETSMRNTIKMGMQSFKKCDPVDVPSEGEELGLVAMVGVAAAATVAPQKKDQKIKLDSLLNCNTGDLNLKSLVPHVGTPYASVGVTRASLDRRAHQAIRVNGSP